MDEKKTAIKTSGLRGFDFSAFWEQYPRKRAKRDAEKAWNGLKVTEEKASHIFALLDRRKREDWRGRLAQYIPYPAHFLRAECFDTEVEAIADDPVAIHHQHVCRICETVHEWYHAESLCWWSHELACEKAREEIKARRARAK